MPRMRTQADHEREHHADLLRLMGLADASAALDDGRVTMDTHFAVGPKFYLASRRPEWATFETDERVTFTVAPNGKLYVYIKRGCRQISETMQEYDRARKHKEEWWDTFERWFALYVIGPLALLAAAMIGWLTYHVSMRNLAESLVLFPVFLFFCWRVYGWTNVLDKGWPKKPPSPGMEWLE